MTKRLCTVALLALWTVAPMWTAAAAENVQPPAAPTEETAAVTPATSPETPASAPAQATPAQTKPAEDKPSEPVVEQVVIDYNEADIQSVLRTLATKAAINLIMGDEIVGKVTVHLEGVSYQEAMQLIVESKGYAFVKDKNVARIKTKEALEAEPLEVRVQTLNYAKADDVRKTLEPVLTRRGKIQVDVRSNTLIISDTPSNLTKVMPLIDRLDNETPQVMIEAKFVETTKNPQKDLGINWSGTLLNHQLTAGGSALAENPGDPPTIIVDDANRPVSGFQWVKRPGGSAFSPWTAGTALLDAGRASVVFSFLSQDSDTELLANPRVVTTDNGKAKIAIATQFPIPNFQFSESSGAFQISGFEYKDIGIVLNVVPRINKNDFVTLEVAPEASSQSGVATLASGSSSVQVPVVDTRQAMTTVLIKSGNTLAIGGLMRQDTSDKYTKVPVLGDLPGLGTLFRSKSLSKTKRDLLIFLTPTIVKPESQTGYESSYNGMPPEEVYTNDKWLPRDNAKPDVNNLKELVPSKKTANQNFGPK
jgi:type IV pilus assembly protein PilQ